jgi:tetratricopeptide (TPR) repeat protein
MVALGWTKGTRAGRHKHMTGGTSGVVFVGRERELDELLHGLDDAVAGRGRLFLIAGEPGIGKSRLADEVAARARAADNVVLSGRCWEAGGAPPYWPWVQSIRSFVRATEPEELRALLGAGVHDMLQLLPELRELAPDPSEAPALDTDAARFRLFDSVTTFLGNASEQRPLVFVLEDVHAADTPSLLLLEFVTRSLADMRTLVMVTYRDVEITRDHPLAGTLVEIARSPVVRRIELGGLGPVEIRRLIEVTTDVEPSDALVDAVFRETEGNPLFAGEIVRLLASEGRLTSELAGSLKPVPKGIRDVIGRRIGHLSERCGHVLEIASVLGREFTLDVLGQLSEREPDELLEILDEAARARLVIDTPGMLGGMRFSHTLVRDTLYEELSSAQRVRLHRRAGQALEQLRGTNPDHLAELAHHYFAASPMGESEKAIDYARRAAEAAQARLAFEEAARLYRMALQAMTIGESADDDTRFHILIALGDALNRAGDAESARNEFLEAAALARQRNDAEGLARAALGYGGRFSWTALRGDRLFVPLLEESLSALGDVKTPLRIMVQARLAAGPLRDDPDPSRRWAMSEQAVEMARELGETSTMAYALEALVGSIMGPHLLDEMLALIDEMHAVATATGDGEKVLMAHVWRLMARLYEGKMGAVSAERREVGRLAEQLRQGPQNWFITCTDASLALFAGRFDEAIRLGAEAYDAGHRAEPYSLFAYRVQKLWIYMEQGRTHEIQGEFRDSEQRFVVYPVWRALLPCLLLSYGTRDEAGKALAEILSEARPDNEEWTLAEGVLAEAISEIGDREAATRQYNALFPYRDMTMGGIPDLNLGSVRRPLGKLAAKLGQIDEAVGHFKAAIETNDRMDARPWATRARFELARVLLDRDAPGDREEAERLLAVVGASARELGMRPLEEGADALTGRSGLGTPTPGEPAATASLFRRDGEYFSISFDGGSFRLRDSKGLRYLSVLLASPGREHHAIELVGAVEVAPAARTLEPELNAGARGEDLLDREARAQYKDRLIDLEEEIGDAEEIGDSERAARAREEQEFVARELAGAMGLGGRARKAVTDAERARVNVTRAIRSAISRIAENSSVLGDHLEATISTGTFCSYMPDPRTPAVWRI